jgi:hypothetical protein
MMKHQITLAAITLSPCACLAGFTVQVEATGQIDAAVIYSDLFNWPYSAVFVDEAGGLEVGDPVGFSAEFAVADDGTPSISNISGFFPSRTFGNPRSTPTLIIQAIREGEYLTAGRFVGGFDLVKIFWGGSDDGLDQHGFGAATLYAQLTLIAAPGSLVSADGRILATSFEEFRGLILDAHLWMDWPNDFFTDSFATDPSYTIVPAPGVLLTLAGALAAQRRRPARITLPRRLPS